MKIPEDLKEWCALSCPTKGLRFDSRTLELLDTDGDGRIRADEILAALAFLDGKGVDRAALDTPDLEGGSGSESVADPDEERLICYRRNLGELLRNYVTMDALYRGDGQAIFQTGVLRIDGREFNLCFPVDDEEAHSALVGASKCCVIYLKLSRPAEKAEGRICAVVTAGRIGGLYVGRNGVFFDRDGKNWEASVTKVVEAQVSLSEAFWAPWRKLGEGIAETVKKFLGDRQTKAIATVQSGTKDASANGAALASSVAAVGIGIGMAGAAVASVAAVISTMVWYKLVIALVCIVLAVSLPSVVIAYFRLRRRDLGAILNASGWAINRELRFSMRLAGLFTRCAKSIQYRR